MTCITDIKYLYYVYVKRLPFVINYVFKCVCNFIMIA